MRSISLVMVAALCLMASLHENNHSSMVTTVVGVAILALAIYFGITDKPVPHSLEVSIAFVNMITGLIVALLQIKFFFYLYLGLGAVQTVAGLGVYLYRRNRRPATNTSGRPS